MITKDIVNELFNEAIKGNIYVSKMDDYFNDSHPTLTKVVDVVTENNKLIILTDE